MTNAARALLMSEGKTDYRSCQVFYYTYSMFDKPNKFKIGVNVHMQSHENNTIKTLVLDDEFDMENAAINFGIDQAKKNIDKCYELGKISASKIATKQNQGQ